MHTATSRREEPFDDIVVGEVGIHDVEPRPRSVELLPDRLRAAVCPPGMTWASAIGVVPGSAGTGK